MIVEPDDEIVASTHVYANGLLGPQAALMEVLANGSSYDPSFGTNGIGQTAFNTTGKMYAEGMALTPDGKIVITARDNTSTTFADVARFLGNSTSSPSFVRGTFQASTIPSSPSSTIVPLVLDDPLFLNSLVNGKPPHRLRTERHRENNDESRRSLGLRMADIDAIPEVVLLQQAPRRRCRRRGTGC